jgi:hypothetical protein
MVVRDSRSGETIGTILTKQFGKEDLDWLRAELATGDH